MKAAVKKISSVIDELTPLEQLREAAECLKCTAHPHRLRIVEILLRGNFSVDEIARLCELSQPATSGHLRLMEAKGLLKSQRAGRVVYYSIIAPQLKGIIDCARAHASGSRDPAR